MHGADEAPTEWRDVRDTFARTLDILATAAPDGSLLSARSWCGADSFGEIVDRELGPLLGDAAKAANLWVNRMLSLDDTAESLVHGDFGGHNFVWSAGVGVGVIDWDHACFSDPTIDVAPLVGQYGATRVRDIASREVVDRAMIHRATLSLQVAAAAHLAGDVALREHGLANFVARAAAGTLADPGGEAPRG